MIARPVLEGRVHRPRVRLHGGLRLAPLMGLLGCLVLAPRALAHDPSAWGGLFRSRDGGATWTLASEGRFVAAAIDLAIDPTDPTHLLLATDSGLLRTRNGGRDWEIDGQGVLDGAVFVVAFDSDGKRELAATGRGLFVRDSPDGEWDAAASPANSTPARAILRGFRPGSVYLVGWSGLYLGDNWGETWTELDDGLPAPPTFVAIAPRGDAEAIFAVAGGSLWRRFDSAGWSPLVAGPVDAIELDQHSGTIWAAGADRVLVGDASGAAWREYGALLPEHGSNIRGIGVGPDETWIVLATDRGLYRTVDRGHTWELLADNLPGHLEAKPLVRDTAHPGTLYAGFSLVPYGSLWREAARPGSGMPLPDPVNLAGAGAFLLLLALGSLALLRRLSGYYGPPNRPLSSGAVPSRRLRAERPSQ